MLLLSFVFVLILLVLKTGGYEQFQFEIPNGANVRNPCDPIGVWSGSGHYGPEGTGPRNAFGNDFATEGYRWTKTLCQKDSDGDGWSNGAELGDPFCIWEKGQQPSSLKTRHPGVCEPWDSVYCRSRNGSVVCPKKLECAAAYEKDVEEYSARLSPVVVPKEDTSFFCQVFNMPSDTDYHLVEIKPELYNWKIVNHITMYACDPSTIVARTGRAVRCSVISPVPCDKIITSYTADFPITCMQNDIGLLVGKNAIKQVVLQVQYSNRQKFDYMDSSGLSVFLTKKLRKNSAGIATLDSTVFDIPPETPSFSVVGGCPSECTLMRIRAPMYVAFGINHMHSLGRKQRVELIRGDKIIQLLTDDQHYHWHAPGVTRHSTPVQVLPGDSLRMICEYNSTGVNRVVKRGTKSSDEMCRSQLIYYPKEAWQSPVCLGFKHVPLCKFETTGTAFNCHYKSFIRSLSADLLTNSKLDQCGRQKTCTPECLRLVSIQRQHACLQGELYELWKSNVVANLDSRLKRLYGAMIPCEKDYKRNAHVIPGSRPRGDMRPIGDASENHFGPSIPAQTQATQEAEVDSRVKESNLFPLSASLNTLFNHVIATTKSKMASKQGNSTMVNSNVASNSATIHSNPNPNPNSVTQIKSLIASLKSNLASSSDNSAVLITNRNPTLNKAVDSDATNINPDPVSNSTIQSQNTVLTIPISKNRKSFVINPISIDKNKHNAMPFNTRNTNSLPTKEFVDLSQSRTMLTKEKQTVIRAPKNSSKSVAKKKQVSVSNIQMLGTPGTMGSSEFLMNSDNSGSPNNTETQLSPQKTGQNTDQGRTSENNVSLPLKIKNDVVISKNPKQTIAVQKAPGKSALRDIDLLRAYVEKIKSTG